MSALVKKSLHPRWKRLRNHRTSSLKLYLAVSYSVLLLVCLTLVLFFYVNTTQSARENFWQQQSSQMEIAVSNMDDVIGAVDAYSRQLLTESTFVRFANMHGMEEEGFVYTAYEVMRALSPKAYRLMKTPISECHIYLKNSGYVISSSQFTEAEQYYTSYRRYAPDHYQAWLAMLHSASSRATIRSTVSYTGLQGSMVFLQDIDAMLNRSVPAIIWYEVTPASLVKLLLPQGSEDIVLYVASADGEAQFQITDGIASAYERSTPLASLLPTELVERLDAVAASPTGIRWQEKQVIRRSGENGWTYTLLLPHTLCTKALGNYDVPFAIIFALAILGGVIMVMFLVRRNMQPYQQLNTRLEQAEGDKAELQREIDAQRPDICESYVRKLLSGHVASSAEFAYMLDFLGLNGEMNFYVLYCVANQQAGSREPGAEYDFLSKQITAALSVDRPAYFYTTLDRRFVVLTAFAPGTADPLMTLQHRVIALHDKLADEHGIWFYAGVGTCCTQPQKLWESYEQARTAARYTARDHIFLPYEMIHKDTDSWYYPIEISAKLQHFITTGNRQQVTEMFALIHRENIEERSLSMPLLTLLLSDLRNTLLKSRFLIPPAQADEHRETLQQLDAHLSEQLSFPMLESLALELCGYFTKAAEPSDPVPEIERYLQENFADPSMCLTKLSDRFNISETYLSHLFKDKTGQNFSVYLENLRLNEAMRRLQDPACNLSTLYMELGYNNSVTFRRAFKKRYGMPPSVMRK